MAEDGAHAADRPGAPLFVRPIYDSTSWVPAALDLGILTSEALRWEQFANASGTSMSLGGLREATHGLRMTHAKYLPEQFSEDSERGDSS